MVDTVKLRSPFLGRELAEQIRLSCQLRSCMTVATGEVDYCLTTASLSGSWDERVSVRLMTEDYIPLSTPTGCRTRPEPVPCEPYLLVEGSVHKALLGHNVHGGPVDVQASCRWFVADIARRLGVHLPDGLNWRVMRIDWAEVYQLPCYEAVSDFIHGLSGCHFPRRKVTLYGDQSVHAPGRSTTVKLYHKGPEFYKHDRLRLREVAPDLCSSLLDQANELFRVEVSVKAPKLGADFGGDVLVLDISRGYLEQLHDHEVGRLLREADIDMVVVRTHVEVSRRLNEVYDSGLASRLFGTWMQLSALGELHLKTTMPKPSFYRQRKQLVEAGVSWHSSDVRVVQVPKFVPPGFSPTRSDCRRLTGVSSEVQQRLTNYVGVRVAA